MEGPLGLLVLMAVLVFLVGPILGIIAFFGNKTTRRHNEQLQMQLDELRRRLAALESGSSRIAPAVPQVSEEARSASETQAPPTEAQPPQGAPPVRSLEDTLKAMSEVVRTPAASPISPMSSPAPASKPEYTPGAGIPAIDPAALEGAEAQESAAAANASETVDAGPGVPPQPPPISPASPVPPSPAPRRPTFEVNLGTKWLIWVGGVFMILFVAYLLKYAYDSELIGPRGRLIIGALLGVASIVVGERFRRKNWGPLFQTMTGIGLAAFYVCIFFSYQVYHLSAAGPSFILAIAVTVLAVALAVFHDTIAIAILAVIGGFLSPVLLSTGENHPYALFLYIAALDLVAIGAAYYRRWHALELLCFTGTSLMMLGWYQRYGGQPDQLTPALIWISVFYLMFLLIPTIHTLTRGLPDTKQGTVLLVLNAMFTALMFYRVLYPAHAHALGFIVLGQSLLLFALFRVWTGRLGSGNNTAQSMLVITLALIIAAVPLHLSRWGIPIVWALEGTLLAYAGSKFRSPWTRAMGVAATLLAIGGLLHRLPLHRYEFRPVFNAAFGSWLLVGAAALASSRLLWKMNPPYLRTRPVLVGIPLLAGFAVIWALLTLEVVHYWGDNYHGSYTGAYMLTSVLVLWCVMTSGVAAELSRRRMLNGKWELLAILLAVATGLVFLASLGAYEGAGKRLFANVAFIPRMAYMFALWWIAKCLAVSGARTWRMIFEAAGFVVLAILLAAEFDRWSRMSEVVSRHLAFSLLSAAWAAEAFVLIWYGLASRSRLRRTLGFVLFAIVVLKVLLVDTSELEKVYRIVSFGATGLLLLAAGYFFQRYSAALMQEHEDAGGEPGA
jgi:uncharacterized membrane protein